MSRNKDPGAEQQAPLPMEQPLKKEGDKIGVGGSSSTQKENAPQNSGGAGEPQTTPLEPEKQGGIGGP
jgi:hypothetical protein